MKNIFKYLTSYKKEAFFAPFFKLLEALFDLAIPLVVSYIIDYGILKNSVSNIFKFGSILIVLAIIGVIIAIIAQFFAAKAAIGIGSKLKNRLFNHIQSFSYKDLDKIQEESIVNIISSDTLQVQNGINLLLRLALRSPFIVLGSMIMAFFIDTSIGFIFSIITIIIFFIVFGITKFCISKYSRIQRKKDKLLKLVQENLSGARVIRAFGIEEKEYKQFEEENDIYTILQKKISKISNLINSLNYLIINLGIILIIKIGGIQVNIGNLSSGNVVALYNYMFQILAELLRVTNLILIIPKTIASSNRIEELLNIKISMENGEELLQENNLELEFNNVSLNYYGIEDSISNISFKIKTGETLGIIGPTGSGKTSIINLIPRFYDITNGSVKINGKDIKEYDVIDLRRNIGIVSQNKTLFSGTIEDNIKFGKSKIMAKDMDIALKVSQAKEFIDYKEYGIKEKVQEGGKNFSGGQKQRINIARAIARNPKILILDDSTSALDLATESKLIDGLNKIRSDKILIMISGRISTIKEMDKILVLNEGKMVGFGKHSELLNSCDVYKEIYSSQFNREVNNG